MFVYKHAETIEYVKKWANFFLKIQRLPVNNSRILRIKNDNFQYIIFLYELEHIKGFSNLHSPLLISCRTYLAGKSNKVNVFFKETK